MTAVVHSAGAGQAMRRIPARPLRRRGGAPDPAWSAPRQAQGATAHLSCRRRGARTFWVVEFAPRQALEIDQLMGWTGCADPLSSVRLEFPTEAAARAFAARQGWRIADGTPEPEGGADARSDPVELASRESFPASDPPAWIASPRRAA